MVGSIGGDRDGDGGDDIPYFGDDSNLGGGDDNNGGKYSIATGDNYIGVELMKLIPLTYIIWSAYPY